MEKINILRLTLAICILVLSGCAFYKGGVIPYRETMQFSNVHRIDGVSVAAEALTDSAKIKEIFYEDLTEKDFYPIEVVIHNGTEHQILVQKEQIEVVSSSGSTIRPLLVDVMIEEFKHNETARALFGMFIFLPVGFPSYVLAVDANKKMVSDWTSKELARELTVNPNSRGSGFVYVKMPKGTKPTGMELLVPVENLETKVISIAKIQL
jgi:hypothetical protein